MSSVVNQVAYLITTRNFPEEAKELSVELGRTYIDIANAVNNRTIGLFPTSRPAITGNGYFLTSNQKQQSQRQVFTFTTTANIAHPIIYSQTPYIGAMYGQYTDSATKNWYGLIAGTTEEIPGQISFYLTPNNPITGVPGNIVFVLGAGAPPLTKGIIVLEWLSNV